MKYQKLRDLENKIRESSAKCISSSDTEVLEKRIKGNHPIRNWIGRHPYVVGGSGLVASISAIHEYARTVLPDETIATADFLILICGALSIPLLAVGYLVARAVCDI